MIQVRNCQEREKQHSYKCAKRKRENLVQTQKTIEERHCGRLSRWLLERLLWVLGGPVFIVALCRHFHVKTVQSRFSNTKSDQHPATTDSSSYMAHGRPSAELLIRSSRTSTLRNSQYEHHRQIEGSIITRKHASTARLRLCVYCCRTLSVDELPRPERGVYPSR